MAFTGRFSLVQETDDGASGRDGEENLRVDWSTVARKAEHCDFQAMEGSAGWI